MTTATQPTRPVTKIELAVLGVIVLGGIGLLLPALTSSRDIARSNLCRRNLRWLDLATQNYVNFHHELPSSLTWPYQLLPRYQEQLGYNSSRTGLTEVGMPRPMFYTCPARSDVGERAGAIQPVHYSFIVDRDQPVSADRMKWRFRDRPAVIETDKPRHWYVGHELSVDEAEAQLRSEMGPHPDGIYLESDSLGSAVVRQSGAEN